MTFYCVNDSKLPIYRIYSYIYIYIYIYRSEETLRRQRFAYLFTTDTVPK